MIREFLAPSLLPLPLAAVIHLFRAWPVTQFEVVRLFEVCWNLMLVVCYPHLQIQEWLASMSSRQVAKVQRSALRMLVLVIQSVMAPGLVWHLKNLQALQDASHESVRRQYGCLYLCVAGLYILDLLQAA